MTTRRIFTLILLAQTGCVAVGLAFHHLYVSSAVAQVEADEARAGLARQVRKLDPELKQQSLSSLQADQAQWDRVQSLWQTAARPTDRIMLLDERGRVVAAAGGQSAKLSAIDQGQPLALAHANAEWGRFDEPIRGVLKDANGGHQVAVAHGLASRDGYLLLARAAEDEKVSPALLNGILWSASGISLLWIVGLMSATMFLLLTRCQRGRSADRAGPEVEALRQAQALVRTQETVIFGLAKLSDSRDPETGSHLERIAQFSAMLAAGLRQRPEFRDRITPGFVQLIGISSALHDIGKVGVEDSILRKPGALTVDQRARMKCHTQIGEECLKEIERRLGPTNFLQMAREIVSSHHEWWNGEGYPRGLSGDQIPLSARIVAVADVYDALRCKRVYKEAMPHEQCVAVIADAAGKQFDPRVVDVFLQIEDRFRQLAKQFNVPDAAPAPRELSVAVPAAAPSAAAARSASGELSSPAEARLDDAEKLLRQANEET